MEFGLLRLGRSCHARKAGIHAEIILERYRRKRLVLALYFDAFLRLKRLVKSVGVSAAYHQSARKLVDDYDLTLLHDVILVALEQRMRLKRLQYMVVYFHIRRVGNIL